MLALIAGTGALPPAVYAQLPDKPLVCALDGFTPDLPVDITFRLEHLGTFLADLTSRGVTQICLAGAVRRPTIDPSAIDAATLPLIPKVQAAMAKGDDGALRILIGLLEDAGFNIVAAHEIAPDLIPPPGVPTTLQPESWHKADAKVGEACVASMGAADSGQACIIRVAQVAAVEGADGTDAMLAKFCEPYANQDDLNPLSFMVSGVENLIGSAAEWLSGPDGAEPVTADDGILFKAPKPNQDRRADLPVIGPDTATRAAEAGLAGIVVEAGGVMVLDHGQIIDILNMNRMFLWIRPRGGA